ncbi:shikimate kinase [Leucobacter allii]|uniref:Shikimate kinase n=1 Tax=Leucobacter allii TaxID=2932247 RepID=A0ABY4FQX1_9MICO|nr:shikimate kinase [Leucobacter allii]UOQ58683.1 shikimate kinase [Leucobacter allii]
MSEQRRAGRDPGPPAPRPKPQPPTAPLRVVPSAGRVDGGEPGGGARGGGGRTASREGADAGRRTAPSGAAPAGQRARGRRRRRRRGTGRLPDRAVVFVGPMAAGKTSLGKRVARELGVPFVDTDAVFVRRHGPIAAFFETHGEPEFRRIEAEVIAEELALPGGRIVALGGGAVITAETRRRLAAHPVVLLLTTQEAVLRTANLAKRPLLRDDPEAWGRILEERRPFYEEVADVTYRTDRATKEQLARRVARWARGFSQKSGVAEHGGAAKQKEQEQE